MKVAGIPPVGKELPNYPVKSGSPAENSKQTDKSLQEQAGKRDKAENQIGRDELEYIMTELNKFMKMANADIKFELHEKTGRLMVQVVDIKEQEVLKEFPPRAMLDMMAKIGEYIGMLLDKRA